jgi:hypothetical protein
MTTLKRFFACLLLLAVPLQGMAAAVMLHCKADHHGQGISKTADSAHSHYGMAQEAHDSHSSAQHAETNASAKCSACSVCCNLAALPTAFSALGSLTETASPFVTNAYPNFGPVLEGPKRPPRLLFA